MRYRRGGSSLPPVVKFLFDLLDAQAKELNLTDPEVLHTWKNNRYWQYFCKMSKFKKLVTFFWYVHVYLCNSVVFSLPLRFWINTIKNPNFIFDVYKSAIVDSCLSVVAQVSVQVAVILAPLWRLVQSFIYGNHEFSRNAVIWGEQIKQWDHLYGRK